MDIRSFKKYEDDPEQHDYLISRAAIQNIIEILEKLGVWERTDGTPFGLSRKIANGLFNR
jgi:hypothetical protein